MYKDLNELRELYKDYVRYYNMGILGIIFRKKQLNKINIIYDRMFQDKFSMLVSKTSSLLFMVNFAIDSECIKKTRYDDVVFELENGKIIYNIYQKYIKIYTEYIFFDSTESQVDNLINKRKKVIDNMMPELDSLCRRILDRVLYIMGGIWDGLEYKYFGERIFGSDIKKAQEKRLLGLDISEESNSESEIQQTDI